MPSSPPITKANVEDALGIKPMKGYDVEAGEGYDAGKEAKHDDGWVPAKHQGMAIAIMVGFAVTFLADFCSKLAYAAYQKREVPPTSPPTKSDFELLFTLNMVYACMFVPCCVCLVAPRALCGIDKIFISLFWDQDTDPNSAGRLMEKQMGFIFLALCFAQLLQPSNTGVGLACLVMASLTLLNFVAAVVFDRYSKLRNRYTMWTGFIVAPVIFIGGFVVALDRVQFFNSVRNPWKDDAAGDGQSLLFYCNMCLGLIHAPISLLNLTSRGERWSMSFFFTEHPTDKKGPIAWVTKNCALGWLSMAVTSIIAPNNTGVAVVMFFLNALACLVFLEALLGGCKTVKNKALWVGFLVNSIVFAVLYAVALNKLDFSYDTSPWNMSN